MKTPEEIKILANNFVSKDGSFKKTELNQTTWGFAERGFIEGYSKCQKDNTEIISFFEEIWEQMNGKTDEKGDMVYIPHTLSQKIRKYKLSNKQNHLIWWDDLSEEKQIQIQKDNGIYGHDEGVTLSEIERFYNDYIKQLNEKNNTNQYGTNKQIQSN